MSEKLPSGWERTSLGDLGSEVRGQVVPQPGTTYDLYSVPAFPSLRPERIDGSKIKSGKRRVQVGDVLLCKINPRINRVWSVGRAEGRPQLASTEYLALRPHERDMGPFIRQFLSSPPFRKWIELSVEGATGSHTRAKSRPILNQPVPIAPMAEQKRIVDALEEHFSRLDAAEATLSATSRKLDAWLTSFLTDACRGPWPKAQLSDIIKSLNNGVFVSRPSAQPPGSPIYRISAVRPLVLRTDDIRYADPVPKMADAYKVESGDILLTRYSGNPRFVGAAAVVPPGGAGILHPDKLIRVVADRSKALPGWIAAYLTVGEGRRGIEQRLKTTAGQVGISGSQLRTVQIAVPPLSHQQKMITKLGVLREAQERMQQQLDGVATQTQALRRSIIAAGFAGRLVPQDPEDEPASVLLERIAASRPTMPARQRRTA